MSEKSIAEPTPAGTPTRASTGALTKGAARDHDVAGGRVRRGLSFNELKQLCALTDGNLNRHLDVLFKAGLVQVIKGYEGRRPHTQCRLTPAGRRRFLAYLAELEQGDP